MNCTHRIHKYNPMKNVRMVYLRWEEVKCTFYTSCESWQYHPGIALKPFSPSIHQWDYRTLRKE